MTRYEVVIRGVGSVGLTAGLYTLRAGLKSLLVEYGIVVGQIISANLVGNYPWFNQGVSGAELGPLIHQKTLKYGLKVLTGTVTASAQGQPYTISTTEGDYDS